ncbi:hypothetical protein F5I97DRAFT_549918 [Phlebopus sp. FC_14]|nr:hypothetical protein F5I97DRAFT_549918 [Phlebopus sp. FC_14]
MFEEICLTCSKHLPDDRRAYCSDDCELLDTYNSPSISSASSALSSPYLDYTAGGEVPALVSSALGTALTNFQKRDRYSASSSSTSSMSWSIFTDAEDDDAAIGIDEDCKYEGDNIDVNMTSIDGYARALGLHHSSKSSSLMYARRPSTTNHRSLIPLLHHRTSSASSTSCLGQTPSTESGEPDLSHITSFQSYREEASSQRERERDKSTVTSKMKKNRNRASLPAYFSLLQISSPQRSPSPFSPDNTDDNNPQPSPPTPKLASLLTASGWRSSLEVTPRGRRREPETSQKHRRSQSRSHSRSRTRQNALLAGARGRQDSRSSVEQVFDWSCVPMSRGRPAARRNSSPLPKMMLSMQEFEDPALIAGTAIRGGERRGRYQTHELDGPGSSRDGPGYGNGRSGLKERVRGAAGRR